MKRLFAVALGAAVLGLAGSAGAQDKKDDAKDYAKLIVGKWEVSKSGSDLPAGSTIEFTKDGKLAAVIKAEGQELKLEGTYKVEKEKLTVKLKVGDQEMEESATIKKLTDDTLEIEDKDKKVDVLKRKKDGK
jgi:uncharacterized protein (TIGR03066 family)